jgi:hypothetical protein
VCYGVVSPAAAVIFVGGDNARNTTDPGAGIPWDHVARVTNQAGTAVSYGSAVYLGNRYMLTANHVSMSGGYVSFNGTDTLQIEATYTPQQVATGVDLKVFRLAAAPVGLSGVPLYTQAIGGGPDADNAGKDSVLVGWGVGRDPDQEAPGDPDANVTWNWGAAAATSDKRWGTNFALRVTTINYTHGTTNYSNEVLVSQLFRREFSNINDDHAAVSVYDSGSALFQLHGGVWYLAGVPITVSTLNSSTFAGDGTAGDTPGDENFFARIDTYEQDIAVLIPEPTTFVLISGMLALAVVWRRRATGRG